MILTICMIGNIFLLKGLPEVSKGQKNNCYIVESFVSNGCFHYLFDNVTAYLMNRLIFALKVLFRSNP